MQQAVCVRRKKKSKKKITEKSAPPKTHNESTAARPPRATRDDMCWITSHALAHTPDSIDPGFVEIGLAQLSQSVKTTNVTHTQTHIPTDKLNNVTLYAPQYEEAFLPIGKKRPRSLRSLGLAS